MTEQLSWNQDSRIGNGLALTYITFLVNPKYKGLLTEDSRVEIIEHLKDNGYFIDNILNIPGDWWGELWKD